MEDFKIILYWIGLIICILILIRLLYTIIFNKTHTSMELLEKKINANLKIKLLKYISELYEEILLNQYLRVQEGFSKNKVSFVILGKYHTKAFENIDPNDFCTFKDVFNLPFAFMKNREKHIIHFIVFEEKINVDLDNIDDLVKDPKNIILRYDFFFNTKQDTIYVGDYFKNLNTYHSFREEFKEFLDVLKDSYITYDEFIYDDK